MKYRKDKYGTELSVLGYGCMRFSKKRGSIDIEKAEREIMAAIEGGVNYFDTAYTYLGSEAALGKILADNNCRDKVYIATKLPVPVVNRAARINQIFEKQLERLRTDHIDYYLMHTITDIVQWDRMIRLGIIDWIKEQKEKGRIRNIGFSFHGNTDMFLKVLDAYDWDFCQIQYNYMDEISQAGRIGLKAANKKGIPVIIMEPLRGGILVNMLPDKAKKLMQEHETKRSPAEWAFRWLYDQPEVTVVLSGMNSMEMVRENIRIAHDALAGSFGEEDFKMINRVRGILAETEKVGCTGCGYCMPCHRGVDIPGIFQCYNRIGSEGKSKGRYEYMLLTGLKKKSTGAGNCIDCGICEAKCPQQIKIAEELKKARRELETPIYKGLRLISGFIFR